MSYQHLVGNKTKLVFLSFFVGLFLFVGSVNAIDVTTCQNLYESYETYYLTQDIINFTNNTWGDNCFNVLIFSEEVTLDCQGHLVDGTNVYGSYGLYADIETYEINIVNCHFNDWVYGISGLEDEQSFKNISNVNITSVAVGLEAGNLPFDFNINNLYISNAEDVGIYLSNVLYGQLDGITIIDSLDGISINGGHNNNFFNININNNEGYGLILQNTYSNTFENITANSVETGLWFINSNSNTLKNIFTSFNSDVGISFINSNSNKLINATSSSQASYGLHLRNSNLSIINNSIFSDNSFSGISLENSYNNAIYNNLFNNTNNFIFVSPILSNEWNTTRQNGTRIIYSEYFDEIGGNYWAYPNGTGYSETCTDVDKDGFCDESYTLNTSNIDYLPLSKYKEIIPEPVVCISFSECMIACYNNFENINKCMDMCYELFFVLHNQNYCLNNVTLMHNVTYIANETERNFQISEYCHYGCSNESLKCNPEPFETNLIIIGGIIIIIIFLLIILKLVRDI